jgi:hypothetical protein
MKLSEIAIDNEKYMNRTEFIKRVFRYILFGLLALIAAATGSRIVAGAGCSSCPGNGICTGENDCSKYLSNTDGKTK